MIKHYLVRNRINAVGSYLLKVLKRLDRNHAADGQLQDNTRQAVVPMSLNN
jgi:hypothetical protein